MNWCWIIGHYFLELKDMTNLRQRIMFCRRCAKFVRVSLDKNPQ